MLRIHLAGPPGSGKTTWLAALVGALPTDGLRWLEGDRAPLADALARLDGGYPVREREPLSLRCRLRVDGEDGPSAQDWFEVALTLDESGGPRDGVLALLPPGAVEGAEPPAGWADDVPLALALSQADRHTGADFEAHLRDTWPEWVEQAEAAGGRLAFFECSSYGAAAADDSARPDPEARPRAVGAPLAWLLRQLHDERWAAVAAAERAGDEAAAGRLAAGYLAAFPVSMHARAAARLAQEEAPMAHAEGRGGRLTLVVAGAALLVALGALAGQLGLWSVDAEPAAATTVAPPPLERALFEELAAACGRRFATLATLEPTSVEGCDQQLYGLRFVVEMTQLDPDNAALEQLGRRATAKMSEVVSRRARLMRLARAAEVRDWHDLLPVIEDLWRQGSKGPALAKVAEVRKVWRVWSARTRGREYRHAEVANELERFRKRLHDLPKAAELLSAELEEANRFLSLRWQWSRLRDGGFFPGVVVEQVRVHRDCTFMRESDGSAQLTIELGGKRLFDVQYFEAREPDDKGWYRYDFPETKLELELSADSNTMKVLEYNRISSNGVVALGFRGPMWLFVPLGQSRRVVNFETGDGKYNVQVALRFQHHERLFLKPLDGK